MIDELLKKDIRTTVWIHPFINPESEIGSDLELRHLFVKGVNGLAILGDWWNGRGYIIDFTNPESSTWFIEQLKKLQEHVHKRKNIIKKF